MPFFSNNRHMLGIHLLLSSGYGTQSRLMFWPSTSNIFCARRRMLCTAFLTVSRASPNATFLKRILYCVIVSRGVLPAKASFSIADQMLKSSGLRFGEYAG